MIDQEFLSDAFNVIMASTSPVNMNAAVNCNGGPILLQQQQLQQRQQVENVCEINIRRVSLDDLINVVKLFQTFDKEKYQYINLASAQNNNNKSNNSRGKANLSLAALRIDERGGIYLNPLLDSNTAYFKCYVAEDISSRQLIGYVLYFNTLDERAGQIGHPGSAADDPVAVIEDLFVKPAYRCRGIATQLFRKVLRSSIERGCFSIECLLIPESPEGVHFWKRRLGENRIQALLEEHRSQGGVGSGGGSGGVSPDADEAPHELVVELNRLEMKAFYKKTALPYEETEEIMNGF